MKTFDQMFATNVRGTFSTSQQCLPYLLKAENPHIIIIAPPLASMTPKWFEKNVPYAMAKFGMSMEVLGLAAEFAAAGVAVNGLWPRNNIATSAMRALGGPEILDYCRTAEIMADAAHGLLTTHSREITGQFIIDEDFLRSRGEKNFDRYAVKPGMELLPDYFVD